MGTILSGEGARGHIVRTIQQALYVAGVGEPKFDGVFDETTSAAVAAFQHAQGLGTRGQIDRPTWRALLDAPVSALSERCLALALWVGERAYGDTRVDQSGALLSWGIGLLSLRDGDLQNFLLGLERSHPQLVRAAFGLRSEELLTILRSSWIDVEQWASRIADQNRLAEPWRIAFTQLADSPEVQAAQRQLAIEMTLPRALNLSERLGLHSERGIALCFLLCFLSPDLANVAGQYASELKNRSGSEQKRRLWLAERLALESFAHRSADLAASLPVVAAGGRIRGSNLNLACWGLSERVAAKQLGPSSQRGANRAVVRDRRKGGAVDGVASSTSPVRLAVASPEQVKPSEGFVAMLSAYPAGLEQDVKLVFANHSRRAAPRLSMMECQWRYGETVRVVLSGEHLHVKPRLQEFSWKSGCELASFAVTVDRDAPLGTTLLEYSVFIRRARIAYIPIELEICRAAKPASLRETHVAAGQSGFASYASADRDAVLGRVSELRLSAGVNVFVDCMDLNPGEQWKPTLEKEIRERDLFFLFWSSSAKQSEWVDWEWRCALKMQKSIQLRPLEPVDRAAPPLELNHLHFNDPYMVVAQYYRDSRSASN